MIPILYESTETEFNNNGLGRLRSCISAVVTEERNGVYECDFSIPVTSEEFDNIRLGRIIGVTHDDSDDIQPFDIVSYEKPIDGIVTFHAVHISYRQSYLTVTSHRGDIDSTSRAFAWLATAEPENPFSYQWDSYEQGFLAAADGIPRTVRSVLGGIEGSILDTYGGEYEWDKFNVILHDRRGVDRDFVIRYGVNMLDYNEEMDMSGTYMSCIPYWSDGTNVVVGDRQDSGATTITNRGECIPLDVSDKFEGKPTKAQVNSKGKAMMNANHPAVPSQTIHVEFVRLQDLGYEGYENLLHCGLCDTINVIFPDYNSSGRFKIVKTVWDVLADRYESMELGDLSVSLSEALGISEQQTGRSSLYKVTTVSHSISGGIDANSYKAAADIAMTPEDGYSAVGIVGHSSNYFRVQPTTNYVKDDSTIYAGFANWSAAPVSNTVTVVFYILWIKQGE